MHANCSNHEATVNVLPKQPKTMLIMYLDISVVCCGHSDFEANVLTTMLWRATGMDVYSVSWRNGSVVIYSVVYHK